MTEKSTTLLHDDDLMAAESFKAGQPHGQWRHLRESCPVYWTQPNGFRPYWSITRHAHILEIEKNATVFLSEPRFMIMDCAFEGYMAEHYGHINRLLKLLVQMDGHEHSQHRKLLLPWFKKKNNEIQQQALEKLCHRYFDELASQGKEGTMNFATGIAFRYPLRVACSLLGTPEEDDLSILALSEETLSFRAPEPGQRSGFEKMLDFCHTVAKDRMAHPRDDLATFLVQSKIDGKPLLPEQFLSHFLIVATAGHDTAATTIMGGVKALAEHQDQWRRLKDNRSLLPTAIEEMLRWVSPNLQFARTATTDYMLDDTLIRAGDSVALIYPSANRDEAVFKEPYQIDIARSPNPHVAFGSGPHTCLGSQLARLELNCFFNVFLDRVEDLELAGPVSWQPNNVVCRFQHIPIRYQLK